MPKIMNRGKQQILFNLLPNRTFDFEKIYTIAQITEIRGSLPDKINTKILMQRIIKEVYAWHEENRPALNNNVLRQIDRFVLIEPQSAYAAMFPKVLWCQNYKCHRVYDFSNSTHLPKICPACQGRLIQLRWVRIHRCGEMLPLTPPKCNRCNTTSHMSLETKDSERISNFQWICKKCGQKSPVTGGYCQSCKWPDPKLRRLDIEVHRANRTYYAHTTALLNIPQKKLDGLLSIDEWPGIAAAKFLSIEEVRGRKISDFNQHALNQRNAEDDGLSGEDLNRLFEKQANGTLTPEGLVEAIKELRDQRKVEKKANSPSGVYDLLIRKSGVPREVWDRAGQDIIETIMPLEMGTPKTISQINTEHPSVEIMIDMGISQLTLVSDYPIITATYGYSRADYQPDLARLNPFPPMREHNGRYPIYIDQVHADALMLSLDPDSVLKWLILNDCKPLIPNGSDSKTASQSYFVSLFDQANLKETIPADSKEVRMVFSLLHTFCHTAIRQAGLLCGLERTSLSEYIMPSTLTFAIYCNHRFGATIGALTALFEQSLSQWLNAIHDTYRCIYDPVCREKTGNCHACTHLPETSCKFFNLNLSRAFLFGGTDGIIGEVKCGYFEIDKH
jgi:ribosomal protein L37E